MPTYLWKATDRNGVESPVKANANTTQEARQALESQGYTNLKLVKDDIMAEITDKSEAVSRLSADEQLKNVGNGKTTFGRYLLKVGRDVFKLTVLCGLLIWWRWWRGDTNGVVVYSLILAFTIVAIAFVRLNSFLFQQLIEAQEWRRPKEMLRMLNWIKTIGRYKQLGLKQEQDARYRALALVWEGKFEEGIAVWKAQEANMKPWTYLSHLSRLHEEEDNIDHAFELREKGIASNPNIAAYWLDLAWKYLEYGRNLPRAKEALARAEALDLTDMMEPFLIRNRGLLAMREGRFEEAEKLLEEAFGVWRKSTKQHFQYSNLMITKGYLCQVRARLGKMKQAREDFAEAKKWLKISRMKILLNGCEAAIA